MTSCEISLKNQVDTPLPLTCGQQGMVCLTLIRHLAHNGRQMAEDKLMSETVDKVLIYLGETPKKSVVSARSPVASKRQAAAGRSIPAHQRTSVVERKTRSPQLPSRAVGRLAAKLLVAPEVVLQISDISARTFQRRQAKQEPLTESESDRVLRIARIAREAERVFGNGEKASRWLSGVSRILGAKPLDLLATDAGARDVEYELVRIDHGDFA
jgi:putative toxin-antitoxin system antitoxin component (TIGR02293 family)